MSKAPRYETITFTTRTKHGGLQEHRMRIVPGNDSISESKLALVAPGVGSEGGVVDLAANRLAGEEGSGLDYTVAYVDNPALFMAENRNAPDMGMGEYMKRLTDEHGMENYHTMIGESLGGTALKLGIEELLREDPTALDGKVIQFLRSAGTTDEKSAIMALSRLLLPQKGLMDRATLGIAANTTKRAMRDFVLNGGSTASKLVEQSLWPFIHDLIENHPEIDPRVIIGEMDPMFRRHRIEQAIASRAALLAPTDPDEVEAKLKSVVWMQTPGWHLSPGHKRGAEDVKEVIEFADDKDLLAPAFLARAA